MADTRLDGSGNYQTRFVNADDYRRKSFQMVLLKQYQLIFYELQ